MQSIQENIIVDLILQHTKKIYMPNGLGGFEKLKDFTLTITPSEAPIIWLNAVKEPKISFITVDPFIVCPEYHPEFADEDIDALEIQSAEDMLVLCIASVEKKNNPSMTINLIAPILINWVSGIGKQVIIKNEQEYTLEYRLLPNTLAEAA